MQKAGILTLVVLASLLTYAQNKIFSIDDAVIGQWQNLRPTQLNGAKWIPNSNTFSFQDYNTIFSQTTQNNDSTVVISLIELNNLLTSANNDSLSYTPSIEWYTANEFHFKGNKAWYGFNAHSRQISFTIPFPEHAENISFCLNNKSIAYTIENNLWINNTANHPVALSNESNTNIVYGQTVSRNEFGIDGGIFWSPKGNYLAFYRKDNSDVKDYPLVNINLREASAEPIKYPMAGMASEHVSVGVYDIAQKTFLFIEKDTLSEKYLTNITWDPTEKHLYIQVLNRKQNHMRLNQYDVSSGILAKTLFEEKHEKYVEPQHPLYFIDSKGDEFIYQSRRDGYNHAYLYNTKGELINQITQGAWEITELLGANKNYLYFIATKESPIERHLYKTKIKNGTPVKLTKTEGTHSILADATFNKFINTFSNTKTPNQINIINNQGEQVKTILKASNPLSEYNLPKMEIGTIKANDKVTDLYYRVIKPIDFDSTKTYPTIIYVYGGPHAQLINNEWLGGARLWQYYMAQKGYVMLTLDNRGSANRGLDFENIIHRQCGVKEMEDQITGINFLKSLKYVDKDRIGVHGWSYGGFMTTSLMVNYPEIFKVGVAGGPVIDWKYYEIMYGERYMDSPEDNQNGYMVTSLIPKAKNLGGKLLIIHGGMDPVVVWQHSQLFIQECIKNQVPIDYFVYPNAEHNVRGYHRIHLMQKVSTYFDDYLK